jgi:hypothetical protein
MCVRLRTHRLSAGGGAMMIRIRPTQQGGTCLLIRVRWDPERRRSAQQVLYTFPADADALPRELTGPHSPLSPAELAQAQAWLAARVATRRAHRLRLLPRQIATAAASLAQALEAGELTVPERDRKALRSALARLLQAVP